MTLFFLTEGFGNLKRWDQAIFLFRRWPNFVRQATSRPTGAGFRIPMTADAFESINLPQLRVSVKRKAEKHGDLATRRKTADESSR